MQKTTKTIFVLVLFTAIISCEDSDRKLEAVNTKYDSLSKVLEQQKKVLDSLQKLVGPRETADSTSIFFGREFQEIENPEEYIGSTLQENPEEIPLDPVLGGTMEFREIKVLTNNWILATYDDGHIQGESIYHYRLQPDGRLSFEVIASEQPE